jgi:DNA-binding transcriptional regulator YiaG
VDSISPQIGLALKLLRRRRKRTRGQLSRTIKMPTQKLYNIESGNSRIPVYDFFKLLSAQGLAAFAVFSSCSQSIHDAKWFESAFAQKAEVFSSSLVKLMRKRLSLTQGQLAHRLGYSSAAMIHHFEKGIRQCSAEDLIRMMILAGDDVQRFIEEISSDKVLAAKFPAGASALTHSWDAYWKAPHISAVRQIMRTSWWHNLRIYKSGHIAAVLRLSRNEEDDALETMHSLGLIKFDENGVPRLDAQVQVHIPRNISPIVLKEFKRYWVDFILSRQPIDALTSPEAFCSVDVLPANAEFFEKVRELVRESQNVVHGSSVQTPDSFAAFVWQGVRVPVAN